MNNLSQKELKEVFGGWPEPGEVGTALAKLLKRILD